MGIFSSKKKTYVSSVTYPLGEDDDERTDFLKQTVINANLQGRPIAESISQAYLRGQGVSLRNAFVYARDHYTNSVPKSDAVYLAQPDLTELTTIVKAKHPGSTINFITTVVGTADFVWWAERYLTETYGYDRVLGEFIAPPDGVVYNASVAFDLETNGLIRILLMNPDLTSKTIDYNPVGLVRMANYVHSAYQAVQVFNSGETTETRAALPGEVDSSSIEVVVTDRIGESQSVRTEITITIAGATATVVTKKRTTVTTRPQYFIYKIGSGTYPELDAWIQTEDLTAPYYPSVPLRVDNKDWTAEAKQDTPLYKTSKKLLNKLGIDIEKVAESINDNDDVKEIDYAFVTFGVRMKTKTQEGKRYIFRYLSYLRNISTATSGDYNTWKTAYDAAGGSAGTAAISNPKTNVVEIYSVKDRANNHDIKIQWQYIDTQLKAGEIFAGAKIGDVELSMGGGRIELGLRNDMVLDSSVLTARRQVSATTYEELTVGGLTHENFIYKGKSVITTAYDAFHNEDEEGFLFPLHAGIIRTTPMREVTDLAYQCMFMVFNCYKVVKQKWYASSWFRIVIIIVAIIIIVVTWGAGTPAAAGLIAGALASVGIVGTLAVVLAATIYVLGMMILMNLLMGAAKHVFGEKWGPIIVIIVMFVTMNWGNLAAAAAGTAQLSAVTIMNAATALSNAYGAYAAAEMSDMQKEALGLKTEFDAQMKEIEDLTKMNLDTSLDMIDIQGYTEATWIDLYEPLDGWLQRTLMTGNDVVEITSGLIENFTAVGLKLPNT